MFEEVEAHSPPDRDYCFGKLVPREKDRGSRPEPPRFPVYLQSRFAPFPQGNRLISSLEFILIDALIFYKYAN